MATVQGTVVDRQWCDAKSDHEIATYIAGLAPRAADGALRELNRTYRATAGTNFGLDPVNMVPTNPVGELFNDAYGAVSGARPPLHAAEIEPLVAWIRAHATPG